MKDYDYFDDETIKPMEEDKKLNSSFNLQVSYNDKDKIVYIGTENSSGVKYKCDSIKQLINSIENYSYDYLDYGKNYSIEIWESEWDRNAGESFIYGETFDTFEEALSVARKLFDKNNFASMEILDNNEKTLYCRDSESEDFYKDDVRISYVDESVLNEYIKNWEKHKDQTFNNNLLYSNIDDIFIAIDNSTGDCWTEEFKTEKAAQKWLFGCDFIKEEDIEIEV